MLILGGVGIIRNITNLQQHLDDSSQPLKVVGAKNFINSYITIANKTTVYFEILTLILKLKKASKTAFHVKEKVFFKLRFLQMLILNLLLFHSESNSLFEQVKHY